MKLIVKKILVAAAITDCTYPSNEVPGKAIVGRCDNEKSSDRMLRLFEGPRLH